MTTYRETLVRKTASMVVRWHGHRARMLELTTSHATLRIVVGDDTYGKNLLISCIDPLYICGPVRWEDSAITLEAPQLDSGEEGIAIIDMANGVRVLAGSVEVAENVKW